MTPNLRTRRTLALGAVLLALAIALPRFLSHTPYPRLGAQLDWATPDGLPRVAKALAPPAQGVLEPGDVLLAIDGTSFRAPELRPRLKSKGWPRGPVELEIRRGGQHLEVLLPPVRVSPWQRLRLYLYPMAAVVAAPLVAFLLVWRRPDLTAAWAFLWFATLQELGMIWSVYRWPQVDHTGAFQVYLQAYGGLVTWFPASFLHFMTVFPRPRWNRGQRRKSAWFWLVVLAYLTPLGLILHALLTRQPIVQFYYDVFQSIALPLGALSLVDRYARPRRDEARYTLAQRTLALLVAVTLLAAAVLPLIPEDPRLTPLLQLQFARVLFTMVWIAWITSPLVIAYLIANDPAFDPRRLLARGIPYALLSGVLAALYLGIVLVAQRLFAAATGEEALVLNVVAALVVAFAFAPLRGRLQRALDRLYGRDPRAFRQALDQAGSELLGALDRDQLRAAVESGLARALRRAVAVEWPETGTPRLAAGEEVPDDQRGAVENLLRQAGIRLENLALQEQRAAHERRAAELREAATRAELRALHAQVQPHFLFNALNALSYLTETDPPAAQRFTERLADMLRYTVEAGSRPVALLSEEIGFVEDYLGVARERYENPLRFEYRGPQELLSAGVPPLLLQPLVENSLKHGCSPGASALHLTLEASRENGWLTLVFSDDGAAAGNGRGLGVGLQNLEQRVRRYGGPEARLEAGPRPGGGFAVTLRWPAASGMAA